MQELKINGIYRHFKGDYYLVEGIAKDSETQEEMIIYRKLYEDCMKIVVYGCVQRKCFYQK